MTQSRGGSRAAATSKMECFVIIVNGFHLLTIITKKSILDVAAALDLPLIWTKFEMKSKPNGAGISMRLGLVTKQNKIYIKHFPKINCHWHHDNKL